MQILSLNISPDHQYQVVEASTGTGSLKASLLTPPVSARQQAMKLTPAIYQLSWMRVFVITTQQGGDRGRDDRAVGAMEGRGFKAGWRRGGSEDE